MGYHTEPRLSIGSFGTRQSRSIAFIITTLTTLFTLSVFLYLSMTPSATFDDDTSPSMEAYAPPGFKTGPLGHLWKLKSGAQWKEWLGLAVDGRDRQAEADELRQLRDLFDQRYPEDPRRPARSRNSPALERLAHCIEHDVCGEGEETVVILSSFHFNNALAGRTGGEDIWARSTIEALTSLNYTLLYTFAPTDTLTLYQGLSERVKLVLWEGSELKSCLARNATNWEQLEAKHDHSPGRWQADEGRFGCIKREGYEDGIPLSKSFTFHFWEGAENPLGHRFTLAPEDYSQWNKGAANRFLGYSIEASCRSVALPAQKQHRGMVLGKRSAYFDVTKRDWPWGVNHTFDAIIEDMPSGRQTVAQAEGEAEVEVGFEMIATGGQVKNGKPEELYDGPIRNLGTMKQDAWYETLAESKFLLGVGRPVISPSPYAALCFGVPFINPITWYDQSDPTDWTLWQTQHNALRGVPEPYVYNVQKGNMEQLERAMRAAVDTPIERYIPLAMTTDAVRERHRVLVETDWTAEAELAVGEIYTDKGREFPWLL